MTLTARARLGPYEIQSLLGSGGMGEVYRARDAKLNRDIALKVLPESFAFDQERLARFQREAQVLASLNHPNIGHIYGLEESSGSTALVLELVEGPTLAERISQGPIPLDEALPIARQIAEALEAAHEQGIIHRDLKPANIKVRPDGTVKVLDFGLAKALAPTVQGDILSSPTLSVAGTIPGVILGTAPYMSPEQAKGLDADQRSDIFSFGAVLYEMLTGRHSFPGDTITEVIASVLARQPDLTALPAHINPRIEDLIRRCLEKDVKRRRQTISDVRVEIETIMADPHGLKFQAHVTEQRPLWKRAIPVAATAVIVAGVTAGTMWNPRSPERPTGVTRFSFALPEGQRFSRPTRPVVAISPDGSHIVYVANNQLYLREMSEVESRPIQGTNLDVDTPLFSPDGRWLAFHSNAEGRFKKIAITGGASVTIADLSIPFGASWGPGDQILIGGGPDGILRVSANGGKPETVVTVKDGEQAHSPQLLPGGDAVLFTLASGGAFAGADRWDKARIVVHSLQSGERKVLVDGGSDGRYFHTGHLLYALGGTLLAVPFDVGNLQVTGDAVPVIEGVLRAGVSNSAANVSISDGGSMVHIRGGFAFNVSRLLAMIDPTGVRKTLPLPPAFYFHPRVSPDGKQLAFHTDDGKEVVVWVYDLAGTTAPRRLTFGGQNRFPIWSRDGRHIVFQSSREGDLGLFSQRADGSGAAERLTKPEVKVFHAPSSWFPDGRTLTFSVGGNNDPSIWLLSLAPPISRMLIDEPSSEQRDSSVSPDGRWVAYHSGESGRDEIYVQPFPPTNVKYQITSNRGYLPIWSPNGRQLIFALNAGGIGDLMSVDIQTQPSFTFGNSRTVIKNIIQNGGPGHPRGFDIAPDGKKFIVMVSAAETQSDERQAQQINVTLNWFEELKRLVPTR